jgi:selenocysteine lyase/cysteine desulfurase
MKPAYLARSSVKISADDHSVLGGLDYEYQVDSKRFEVGSFNLAGAFAANASLGLLLDLGIKNIERHVLSLSSQLKESVAELGMPPAVPNTGADHSHIVTFGDLDHGGHGFSNDPKVPVISEKLNIAKIKHTIRRGQLRFAIHAYNNAADISHTAEVIGDALKDL